MNVLRDGSVVRLTGHCRVEDAEPLLAILQAADTRSVDLSEALSLHTAVVQILIAMRPEIRGTSPDPFTRTWIEPVLRQAQAGPVAAAAGN
jgi:hypothetical protein